MGPRGVYVCIYLLYDNPCSSLKLNRLIYISYKFDPEIFPLFDDSCINIKALAIYPCGVFHSVCVFEAA